MDFNGIVHTIVIGICICFGISKFTACTEKTAIIKAECTKAKSYEECKYL